MLIIALSSATGKAGRSWPIMAAKKFIVELGAAERERLNALIAKGKAPAAAISATLEGNSARQKNTHAPGTPG